MADCSMTIVMETAREVQSMRRVFILLACSLFLAGSIFAVDEGIPDTVSLVVTVNPDANASQMNLQVDLYVFTDNVVVSGSAGFVWDNPNLQIDSAIAQPLIDNGFEIGPFFFEDNNIVITNNNQHFMVGGAALFGAGIPPDATTRRLWASYYFTLSDWSVTDEINIDTLTFNAGSVFVLNSSSNTWQPQWDGALHIVDPNASIGANLLTSVAQLDFSGVVGEADPTSQTFTINSDGMPLNFTLSKNATWLGLAPTAGTTPQEVTVSVTNSGLVAGLYLDTIFINSTNGLNSPIIVPVSFDLNAPVNDPPILGDIGNHETTEGVQLSFQVTASDPQGTTPLLATSTLPIGAIFSLNSDGSATFDWTPGFDDAGFYDLTFYAFDEIDPMLKDSEMIQIVVLDSNRTPSITFPEGQDLTVTEGGTIELLVTGSDPDGTTPVLGAVFQGTDSLALNMSFVDSGNGKGVLIFSPDFEQGNNDPSVYPVVFSVFDQVDPALSSSTDPIAIEVFNLNRAPVLSAVESYSVCIGTEVVMSVSASDDDGDPITMWLTPSFSGLAFTDHGTGTGTGTITVSPDATQLGVHSMTLFASDAHDTVSTQFDINVIDCADLDVGNITIDPDTLLIVFSNTVNPIYVNVILGNFNGGHTADQIDQASVMVNSVLSPHSITLLPSYEGFGGSVLSIDIDGKDLVESYGHFFDLIPDILTVEGAFIDTSNFSAEGAVMLRGHISGDMNGDGSIDNVDLTALINYMFMGGSGPVIAGAADMDGSCTVDVLDITSLIRYLYKNGPVPQSNCRQ